MRVCIPDDLEDSNVKLIGEGVYSFVHAFFGFVLASDALCDQLLLVFP